MASHIHTHVDGKQYRREFVTGRKKLPVEFKKIQCNICLTPQYKREAEAWREKFGISFSEWVENEMFKKLYNETA